MKRALVWAGVVVLAAGILTGLAPLSSHSVDCGSALIASDADPALVEASSCDSLRSLARIPALILGLAGVALLAAGWWGGSREVDLRGHRRFLGRPVGRGPDES